MASKNPLIAWYARADARAAELHRAGEAQPRHCLEHPSWPFGRDCKPCQTLFLVRQRKNARARASILRDLGLVKTPYGWE
jgi:hypothetical protein